MNTGVLVMRKPAIERLVPRRRLFVTREIEEEINASANEPYMIDLCIQLSAFLTERNLPKNLIWWNNPVRVGVWEIRAHSEDPQTRMFGQFAARDVFVGLRMRFRDDIGDFAEEIKATRREWKALSPLRNPVQSKLVHRYFSGATDDYYNRLETRG